MVSAIEHNGLGPTQTQRPGAQADALPASSADTPGQRPLVLALAPSPAPTREQLPPPRVPVPQQPPSQQPGTGPSMPAPQPSQPGSGAGPTPPPGSAPAPNPGGAQPGGPVQLDPGDRDYDGGRMGTHSARAQVLENLLYRGEAWASTDHGVVHLRLDHDTGEVTLQYVEGTPISRPEQSLGDFGNLARLYGFHPSQRDELPDSVSSKPALEHYLATGEIPRPGSIEHSRQGDAIEALLDEAVSLLPPDEAAAYREAIADELERVGLAAGEALTAQDAERFLVNLANSPALLDAIGERARDAMPTPTLETVVTESTQELAPQMQKPMERALTERLEAAGITSAEGAQAFIRDLHTSPVTTEALWNRAQEIAEAQGSARTPALADWSAIDDPGEAWKRFAEQYPDLADMVDRAGVDREAVMEMMKRGFVLSEVLAHLRDGGLGSGRLPPDGNDRLRTAGGFEEPGDNERQRLEHELGRRNVEAVIATARELDIAVDAVAEVIQDARARGNGLFNAYQDLQAAERVQDRAPSTIHGEQVEHAKNAVKRALDVWRGAVGVDSLDESVARELATGLTRADQIENARAQVPLKEALGPLAGDSLPKNILPEIDAIIGGRGDVTFSPAHAELRGEIEAMMAEAKDKSILPDSYRVALTMGVMPLKTLGMADPYGNMVINLETIAAKREQGDTEPGNPLDWNPASRQGIAHTIGHELGHVTLNEALRETYGSGASGAALINVVDMTVFMSDFISVSPVVREEFSPYVYNVSKSLSTQPEHYIRVYHELGAELSGAAMSGREVPEPVIDLAEKYYPEAFMEKIRPHLNVVEAEQQ